MSAILKFDDNSTVAEIEVRGFRGEPGLGHALLKLDLTIHMANRSKDDDLRIRNLEVACHFEAQRGSSRYRLARFQAEPQRTLEAKNHSHRVIEQLEAEVAYDRIARLEALRRGDFWIVGELRALLASKNSEVPCSQQLLFEVNQSAWIEVLRNAGYAEIMLLELPKLSGGGAELSEAVGKLKAAEHAIFEGRYREAVAACREVLEALKTGLGDDDSLAKPFANTLGKSERMLTVRRALRSYTHPAHHHDATTAGIEFRREDAVCIFHMTASVVAYYGEQLRT